MPYENVQIGGLKVPVLSWTGHDFKYDEQNMIRNVSRLPCVFKHVSIMADGHLGSGSMVGSVIATKDAVCPSFVGVDIGCGMMALKTQFKSGKLDRKLPKLFEAIEKNIPVGFNEYGMSDTETRDWNGFARFNQLHSGVQDRKVKAMNQLGTLGGGKLPRTVVMQ
jgi:tRNA-splicing ligase RtcB